MLADELGAAGWTLRRVIGGGGEEIAFGGKRENDRDL